LALLVYLARGMGDEAVQVASDVAADRTVRCRLPRMGLPRSVGFCCVVSCAVHGYCPDLQELAAACHALEVQLWGCLQAFANWPTDGAEVYPGKWKAHASEQ